MGKVGGASSSIAVTSIGFHSQPSVLLHKEHFLKLFSEKGKNHYIDNAASRFTLRVNEFFRHSANSAFCVSRVRHLPRLFQSLPNPGSCLQHFHFPIHCIGQIFFLTEFTINSVEHDILEISQNIMN